MSTPSDNPPAWRLAAGESIPLREWDGDFVVYNPLSGNTHVLDIVTGEILKSIMVRPKPSAELCRHIAGFLDVPNDASVAAQVSQILATLDRLAVIEPVAGC